jgi:hypothetical protein
MLRDHPQIFLPKLKEPEFLASDMRRLFKPSISGPVPTTMAEYLALFAGARADQLAGEASAFYLSSHTAAASIAELNPKARVIAIYREPASFLRSLHLQLLQDHVEEERDFARALALEEPRRNGKHIPRRSYRPQALQYSDHVRYADQLARYHAAFPQDQVLVLIYEEFKADNAAAMRRILRFLDVDDSVALTPQEVNRTVAIRSQALDAAVHRYSVGRGTFPSMVKTGVKALVPRRTRRALLHSVQTRVVRTQPPPPDERVMAELRQRCKPEVERLSEYLGRDLVSLWGYERV